ncbi:hypothetical protein GQ600_26287 [Phytophthora cactorum]|nr:hypothetical protein GQ600_26287 [Phytophthora cactorum]
MIALLMRLYKSKESLILTLNALCKMVKNRFRDAFGYYNAVKKSAQQAKQLPGIDVCPQKVKKIIMDTYGEIFLSNNELSKLTKMKRLAYLRLVFDYIALYLNVHYPLRFVWPTNVRLMGPQVIELDGSTMNLIARFLHFLSDSLGQNPTNFSGAFITILQVNTINSGFSSTLSKLFVKYNGKPMSMNMIRHIVESHLIQSQQKHDLHAKLLHSTFAANTSYNKIANRSTSSEVVEEAPDFSFESAPQPQSPGKPPTRSKARRERIFHGDFKPSGSDKTLEIEVFEKANHNQMTSKRGPHLMSFNGLHARLRSGKSNVNLKTMLVSHAFVDLWHMIEDDKSFDKHLFDLLDEPEQDFMRYCLNKCHIKSREFDSAYNEQLDSVVKRLKMLQGATSIGDDNPSIKKEMKQLLDKLYEKGVFSTNYYTQFKRLMKLS